MLIFINQLASSTYPMKFTNAAAERLSVKPNEVYIEFLTRNLGASREEVLDVVKRSGISARRISEYLLRHQQVSKIAAETMFHES